MAIAANPGDVNSPNYVHPLVLDYRWEMGFLKEVWDGLRGAGVKGKYCPKEEREPGRAYQQRLDRCRFDNRFQPAIKDYSGLLSVFTLNEDTPKSIISNKENIDQQGSSIWTFLSEADQMALRDGWCGIYVDYPPTDENIQSQGDLLASDRRPYLVLIERGSVINWDFEYDINGKPVLKMLVLQESVFVRTGKYGHTLIQQYRVLYPGSFEVWGLVPSPETQNVSDTVLELFEAGETSLETIPFVYYSVSGGGLFQSPAPFLNLALLNVEHYQKRSQKNEVLRKCNLPVPVRRGAIRDPKTNQFPPLIIGPNSCVDVPENGDFFFAEPSGAAIASTSEDIKQLELAMDRTTLDFLTNGDGQKTATEVIIDSAKTGASLTDMARRKESAVQSTFELWIAYTGESEGGGITMDESLLQTPMSPEEIGQITNLASQGFISQKTLLTTLQQGKILSKDFDVDAELVDTQQVQEPDDPEKIYPEGEADEIEPANESGDYYPQEPKRSY